MRSRPESAVCWSARILAGQRANEFSRGDDALVLDHLAEHLADTEQQHSEDRKLNFNHAHFIYRKEKENASEKVEEVMMDREIRPETLIRTRYIDLWVRENAKLVEQIVLLGAGLDARAYRTQEIKHCTVFEIDRQEVLEYKARILKKFEDQMLCRKVVRVVGDLKESKKKFRKPKGNGNSQKPQGPFWEDLLLDAGFDPLKPTIWIAEGLLMYLDKNEVQGLLQSMADISQANSLLIGDIVNSATLKSKYYWYRIFRWGCDRKNLSDTLRIFRWKVLSAEEIGKDGISYGRYLADPLYLSEEQFPSLSEEERKLETFMAVAEVVPKRKHFPASECKENTI